MTKFSCKHGDFASSVVLLRDGRVMEVRRGEKTNFAKDERVFWVSLDAWKATLPEGGTVVSDCESPKNPVLKRVLERVGSCSHWRHSPKRVRNNIHSNGTYAQSVQSSIIILKHELRKPHATWAISSLQTRLAAEEAKLATILASDYADKPKYIRPGRKYLYALLPSGDLVSVFHNIRLGVIMTGVIEEKEWKFTPLTDPELPMWILDDGVMMKI